MSFVGGFGTALNAAQLFIVMGKVELFQSRISNFFLCCICLRCTNSCKGSEGGGEGEERRGEAIRSTHSRLLRFLQKWSSTCQYLQLIRFLLWIYTQTHWHYHWDSTAKGTYLIQVSEVGLEDQLIIWYQVFICHITGSSHIEIAWFYSTVKNFQIRKSVIWTL